MTELIKPTSKIRILNKLPLPDDVINEIYKHLFYDITKLNFYKLRSESKKETNKIISSAYSRTNIPYWWGWDIERTNTDIEIWESRQEWIFSFSSLGIIHGENCKKCGEYIYLSYSIYPTIHSNITLCNCL